jgi:hypothetical protein
MKCFLELETWKIINSEIIAHGTHKGGDEVQNNKNIKLKLRKNIHQSDCYVQTK